jgi:hypothetical protein
MRAGRSNQDRDVALRSLTWIAEHCRKAIKALLSDVNALRRTAGLRHALGSFDEEVFETATEIK